jgi:hypothetical protein
MLMVLDEEPAKPAKPAGRRGKRQRDALELFGLAEAPTLGEPIMLRPVLPERLDGVVRYLTRIGMPQALAESALERLADRVGEWVREEQTTVTASQLKGEQLFVTVLSENMKHVTPVVIYFDVDMP